MRYRYRTEALVGPWRETRAAAEADAIAAGQAEPGPRPDAPPIWRVLGSIEIMHDISGPIGGAEGDGATSLPLS